MTEKLGSESTIPSTETYQNNMPTRIYLVMDALQEKVLYTYDESEKSLEIEVLFPESAKEQG